MPYKEKGMWRAKVTRDGRRYTCLKETKGEALDWESEKRKELKESSKTDTAYLFEVVLGYLDYAKEQYSHSTYTDKKKTLEELMALTGNVAIEQISPAEILGGLILTKKTHNLANKRRKDLHAFFEHCRKFHGLARNPITDIAKFPQERKAQPVPTDTELAKLLLVAGGRQDRNMLVAFANSGARRSELFRCKFSEDVDFAERMLRLGNRKNRAREMRYRFVPMNDALNDALQDQFRHRLPDSDYVFQVRAEWVDRDGNVTRRHPKWGDRFTARRRYMKGLCKQAKVKAMGFHSLRRYFASKLVENGEDLETVRYLLGHATVSTTDRYVYRLRADMNTIRAAVHAIQKPKGTEKGTKERDIEL